MTDTIKALAIGTGRAGREARVMKLTDDQRPAVVTTIDINPDRDPDILWDLNELPWPAGESEFDEVHAYEVLEHLGQQGDFISFFHTFDEIARVTKVGGHLFGSVPDINSRWVWADPGHTRLITVETLQYLNRKAYCEPNLKHSPMSDYRKYFTSDWEIVYQHVLGFSLYFVLKLVGK